jgi:DNA-directed RNA polymerase specialized sigma24 family protein
VTKTFSLPDAAPLAARADATAARLCRRLSLPPSDKDDLRQELLADLIRRFERFDPARGCLGAFATVVLRHQSTKISARILAARSRSGGPLLSLDLPAGPEPLVETLLDEVDAQAACERRIDLGRVVARLPRRDRALCLAVARWPVDRLVHNGFGSRAGLYRRLHELRHVFAAQGLRAA